ncbi:hypothetical protein C8R47DRAFT_1231120 [Mycena vitilis]|nr:hypothetical protein C8R47DRAFT_1231120 [Mycena vitilis]
MAKTKSTGRGGGAGGGGKGKVGKGRVGKVSAQKSTGGKAPRVDLSLILSRHQPEPAAAAHEPTELNAIPAQAVSVGQRSNVWCSGCEDGGTLYGCALCPRHICTQCIRFPDDMSDSHTLYCPRCWSTSASAIPSWKKQIKGGKIVVMRAGRTVPYHGLWKRNKPLPPLVYTGSQTLRAQWPLFDTERLAIFSIRLDGTTGDFAHVLQHHLAPYYREEPIWFEEIEYHIGDDTRGAAFRTKHNLALNRMSKYVVLALSPSPFIDNHLCRRYKPTKVVIFLTTHVEPAYGCIHLCADSSGADDANQVLPILIPEKLQTLVRNAKTSLLVLLACGELNRPPARDQVSVFVQTAGFQNAIGFTISRFIPTAAHTFLQDTVMSFFIQGHVKKFPQILASHYELGIHTDVIVYFQNASVYRYAWTHPHLRPYGHPAPHQCPQCKALASFEVRTHTASEVVLACKACDDNACDDNGYPTPWTAVFPCGALKRIDNKLWKNERAVEGVCYGQWLVWREGLPASPVYGLLK